MNPCLTPEHQAALELRSTTAVTAMPAGHSHQVQRLDVGLTCTQLLGQRDRFQTPFNGGGVIVFMGPQAGLDSIGPRQFSSCRLSLSSTSSRTRSPTPWSNWLTPHHGAKVIWRDRDGVYASTATRGATWRHAGR